MVLNLQSWLSYETDRKIIVDNWFIGLVHYTFTGVVVFGVVIYNFGLVWSGRDWAYSELPAGRVNAYVYPTASFNTLLTNSTQPSYCDNVNHDYVSSLDYFRYVVPSCRGLQVEEVATKGIGALTVTTSVIESTNLGFACADVDDIINRTVSWRTRCAEIGAAIVQTGLQCECETSETFYTKGVEELEIAFEHSYSTTSRVTVPLGSGRHLHGSSTAATDGVLPTTRITFPNAAAAAAAGYTPSAAAAANNRFTLQNGGASVVSMGGRDIHLPLGALISLGQPSDSTDTLALDATNIWVNQTDARTGMQNNKPMFRTTGMQVTVEIVYDNMVKWGIGEFEMPSSNVTAQVEVSIEKAAWAGSGPQVLYTQTPRFDAQGSVSYEKLTRYRQGVVIVFRPSGRLYAVDIVHLMTVIATLVIFTRIPSQIIDFLLFVVLPYLPCCGSLSKVYSIKRAEHVSRVRSFAQLGLKAAVAVEDFKCLDVDDRGFIEVKDLASVFGKIPTIDKSNALLIGQAIMRACKGKEKGRISFNDFVSLAEGGGNLDFDKYVDLVKKTGNVHRIDQTIRAEAMDAYDAVESGVDLNERKKSLKRSESQAPAGAAQEAITPAAAAKPTQTLTCYLCKFEFGVPEGAKLVKCPRCQTINPTSAAPAQLRRGNTGAFGLGSVRQGLGSVRQVQPMPVAQPTYQTQMPVAQPAMPVAQPAFGPNLN